MVISSYVANALLSSVFSSKILNDVSSVFLTKGISNVLRRFREPVHVVFIWKTHPVFMPFNLFVEFFHLMGWVVKISQAFYSIICATTQVNSELLVSINYNFVPVAFTTHYVRSNFNVFCHSLIFMKGIAAKRVSSNSFDWFHPLKLFLLLR